MRVEDFMRASWRDAFSGMRRLRIEATKFTLVGAANFILTFLVFTTMLKIMAVNYLFSLATAWIVGIIFSYVMSYLWVFKPERMIQFNARFIRYFLAGLVSIGANMIALGYWVRQTGFDPFYLQMALMPFIVIFNFITAKFWSLKRNKVSFYDSTIDPP